MQQPPNQEYPQQQWPLLPQPLPTQQQWQQQTNYGQSQYYYPPLPTPTPPQWNAQQPPFPQQQYQQTPQYQPSMLPPKKKSRKGLYLILGVILAVVLIGYIGVSAIVKAGGQAAHQTLNQTSTQVAQLPLTQSPTPTFAPGYGFHMMLGHSYSCSPACLIDNPINHFNATSQFAFVVIMFAPMNTTHVKELLVALGEMGSEAVVYTEDFPLADPNENNLWNSFPTSSLMGSNPYGNYRLEIEDDTTIRAYADFIYEK